MTRDELVVGWRVNGDYMCQRTLEAAPGCYVLEVKYSAEYVKEHGDDVWISYMLLGPVGAGAHQAAQRHRVRYNSGSIAFAMHVEPGRSYYVTSTFTGDEFIPRIAVADASGERVAELRPTRDKQELAACRKGTRRTSRRVVGSCG